MAIKRRLAGSIRRERRSGRNAIAAELECLQKENAELRALLWEFLSTHCAPLELRARATAAVGCIPTGMP